MIWNHPNDIICFDNYSLRKKLLWKLNRTAARIVCQTWKDNYASVLWSLFSSNKCAGQNANGSFYKIHPAQIAARVKNNGRDASHIIPIDCRRQPAGAAAVQFTILSIIASGYYLADASIDTALSLRYRLFVIAQLLIKRYSMKYAIRELEKMVDMS